MVYDVPPVATDLPALRDVCETGTVLLDDDIFACAICEIHAALVFLRQRKTAVALLERCFQSIASTDNNSSRFQEPKKIEMIFPSIQKKGY